MNVIDSNFILDIEDCFSSFNECMIKPRFSVRRWLRSIDININIEWKSIIFSGGESINTPISWIISPDQYLPDKTIIRDYELQDKTGNIRYIPVLICPTVKPGQEIVLQKIYLNGIPRKTP